MNNTDQLREWSPYHLHSCHSRQAWFKGQTEPFPCDCGLESLINEAVREARIDELKSLGTSIEHEKILSGWGLMEQRIAELKKGKI